MSAGAPVFEEETRALPQTLLDVIDGQVLLSPWGTLLWNQSKHELLAQDLVPLPRLRYAPSFEKDVRALRPPRRRVALQETLAYVSRLLEEAGGSTRLLKQDGGLQYQNYAVQTYERLPVGHFRLSDEDRAACVAREGTLELLHAGAHDDVNPR